MYVHINMTQVVFVHFLVDIDGDGYLNVPEIEALFQTEVSLFDVYVICYMLGIFRNSYIPFFAVHFSL